MRKISIAFLLALTSLVVNAQVYQADKPVKCSSLKNIIEFISGQYKEEPFWRGGASDSRYILMVNSSTGTWTMVEYDDKMACVVGVGKDAHLINLGKNI